MPLCGHLVVTCPPVTRCCLTTGLGRSVVKNLERSCVYQNLEVYVCMCVYVILSVCVYILLSVLQGRKFHRIQILIDLTDALARNIKHFKFTRGEVM